jgi:hypothetical protein
LVIPSLLISIRSLFSSALDTPILGLKIGVKEPIDFDAQVNVTASGSDSLKASVPDVPSYFRAQVARRLPPVVRVCNRCRGHLRKGVAFTVLWQSPASRNFPRGQGARK